MTFASGLLRSLLGMLAATLLATGCVDMNVAAQDSTATAVAETPVYKLGAGDKIRVTVFGEQSLNGEYPVGPDGTVALPLIGNVQASGMTSAQVQQAIVQKLSPAYILDPRVSVDVVNFRPFYILGEVSRPGSFPYTDTLSVQQAVAIAGGYTYRANSRRVFIRRANSTAEVEYSLKGGKQIWVLPGDTVRIPERFF